jgi:hypothetical protein
LFFVLCFLSQFINISLFLIYQFFTTATTLFTWWMILQAKFISMIFLPAWQQGPRCFRHSCQISIQGTNSEARCGVEPETKTKLFFFLSWPIQESWSWVVQLGFTTFIKSTSISAGPQTIKWWLLYHSFYQYGTTIIHEIPGQWTRRCKMEKKKAIKSTWHLFSTIDPVDEFV